MYQITDFRTEMKTLQNTFVEFNSMNQEFLTINF